MKTLSEFKEENPQVNESIADVNPFDVSLAVFLYGTLSYVVSMGFGVTGRIINSFLAAKNHDKRRIEKNRVLMQLKELTRSIPNIDDEPAKRVLNDPGEWDSTMIDELRRALFEKMTPEQQEEFNKLEHEYYIQRSKTFALK